MSTRVIRSFADLDTMQGLVGLPIKQDEPAWRDVLVVAFTKIQP